jgi:FixJ family two-component response regulator
MVCHVAYAARLCDSSKAARVIALPERGYENAVSPVKIYVIDDDASVRKALKRLIRSAGMSAHAFASAEDFLSSSLPLPDCLVLDLRMPGMSGLELQQQLAAEGRSVPIVFISAHDDAPTRFCALAAGAIAFLHKPFDDNALLDAIAQATPLA